MKKHLLKHILLLIFFTGFLSANCFGQTFGKLTGGLASSISSGNSKVAVLGFYVQVSSGSITFNKFTFGCSPSTSDAFLGNGTLYRSSGTSYSSSSPGVPVGNVTFSGGTITIDNLSETVSSRNNYFLVADAINTSSSYFQLVVSYGNTFATDVNGNSYPAHYSDNEGYSYGSGTPYPLTISNQTSGLASPATVITPGTNDLKLFAFSITNTSGSSYTLSGFNIYSNLANLSATLGNFKLYSSTTNTFPGDPPTASTLTATGSYVNFTPSSETIGAHGTKYYWLVADCPSGSTPADVQFNFSNGQTNNAVTASSPGRTFNTFTLFGNTYTINTASPTVSLQTGGISSGTITAGQTDIAVFGFSIAVSGSTTISDFNINSNNANISDYFGNAELYWTTTSTYSVGSRHLVANGTISPGSNYVNFTGLSETITNATKYYFLVVDNIGANASNPTVAFNFTSGQSSSSIIQSSPTSSYNNFSITGNTFTIPSPTFIVTGLNNPGTGAGGNNITNTISPGTPNIAVFGFKVQAFGQLTVDQFNFDFPAGSLATYFSGAKVYYSTDEVYSAGDALVGTVALNSSYANIGSMGLSLNNETRNYFLVVDVNTFNNSSSPTTAAFRFDHTQAHAALILNPYKELNTYDVPGATLNFPPNTTFIWTGNTSTDITNNNNWSNFNVPTSTANMTIPGGRSRYPVLTANATIASLTFSGLTPTITVNSGKVLTISGDITIASASTPTITGPGTITSAGNFTNNASAVTALTALITLSAGGMTNSGTINQSGSGSLSVAAASTNSGTYNQTAGTLSFTSTLNNSGTIAQSSTSALTVSGALTNTGAINKSSTGTVSFNGAVTNNTGGTITQGGASGALTFGSTTNNTGTISQTAAGPIVFTGTLTNNSGGGTLTLGSGATTLNADLSNAGTITQGTGAVTVAGTLTNAGTYAQNNTGTVTAGALLNSGTYNQSSSGNLSVTGLMTNSGTYNQSSTGTVTAGSLSNSGNYQQTSTSNLSVTGDMTNAGTYTQTNSGNLTVGGTLTNNSAKTITLNTSTTTLNGDLSNAGTITQGTGAFDFNGSTFTNSGTFTITSGANNFAGTSFNNTGTLTLGTGIITFDGSGTTSISTTPALTFNNLTFSNGGTKTLTSGSFNIGNTGTLTMSGSTTLNANGNLTLKSDATSTATVAALPSGASITGNVTAERYIPAGNRGYRLFSSPVSNRTSAAPYTAGLKSYDLSNLQTYTLISGPAGNGFNTSPLNNPSVFVYDEALPTPVNNNVSTSDYKGFASISEYIPIGNGILFFYRGNQNTSKTGGSGNAFVSPYPTPEATTLTWVGAINSGTINVTPPVFKAGAAYYNVLGTATGLPANTGVSIASSTSTNLSYTTTALPGTDGFNLVGNPFPSTIDLEKITLAHMKGTHPTVYTLNSVNGLGFGTYTLSGDGTGGSSTTGTVNNGGSRYVLSGEGFFVQTNAANATVSFPETAKATYPAGNVPVVFSLKDKNPSLRVKLVQDSVFYNETQINFSDQNSNTFTDDDVFYLTAPSQQVFMYSNTDDGSPCIINNMGSLENVKSIKLYAEGAVTGTYQMQFSNANTIDSRYRIFLKDAFTKDSLDVTSNVTYNFNINRANAATYGASRFSLVVYKDNNAAYKLVSFIGNKDNQTAKLTWTVQNESDVMSFALERSIDGGKTFTVIGSVQSNSLGTYNYTDISPVFGDNIYRLKQSDVSDKITYSDLVTLTFEDPNASSTIVSVYPNPASQKINVDFTQTILNSIELHIVNTSGKLVKKATFNAAQHIEQDVSNLQTGIYVVDIFDSVSNKKISSLKFIKI